MLDDNISFHDEQLLKEKSAAVAAAAADDKAAKAAYGGVVAAAAAAVAAAGALVTRVAALGALRYLQIATFVEHQAVAGFEKESAPPRNNACTEEAFVYKAVLIDTAQCAGIDFICGLKCAEDMDFLQRVLGSATGTASPQKRVLKINRPVVIDCSVLSADKVQNVVPLWDKLIMPWRTQDSKDMRVAPWEIDALQCLQLWIHKLRMKSISKTNRSISVSATGGFRAVMLEIDALAKSLLGGITNPDALARKAVDNVGSLTHLDLGLSKEVFDSLKGVTGVKGVMESLLHMQNSTAGLVDKAIEVVMDRTPGVLHGKVGRCRLTASKPVLKTKHSLHSWVQRLKLQL